MRLTKYMKEELYNIIKNQTKDPLIDIEHECQTQLQEWVFNHCEPCVRDYYNAYSLYEHHYINFSERDYNTLNVLVPSYRWFTSDYNPHKLLTNNYCLPEWKQVAEKHPELAEICDKFHEGLQIQKEYLEHLANVKTIIFNCNTDKQLSEVFPEFVQFFNKAGIVQKATPQLPAKLGLPEALCKYGFKLETVESVEEQIREETNE